MTKTFTILFVLMCAFVANGQEFAMELTRMNTLYIGIANPLKVAMANVDCDDIELIISQGSISVINSCEYEVQVDNPGICSISVVTKKDTIVKLFRVLQIPNPTITLGGDQKMSNLGQFSRATIGAKGGVVPIIFDMNINARFIVKSYDIIFFNDSVFNFFEAIGPIFPAHFKNIVGKEGVLIFNNFVVKSPSGRVIQIEDKLVLDVGLKQQDLQTCAINAFEVYKSVASDTVNVKFLNSEYNLYKADNGFIIIEYFKENELKSKYSQFTEDSLVTKWFYIDNGVLIKEYQEINRSKVQYFNNKNVESRVQYKNEALKVNEFIERHENGMLKVEGLYKLIEDVNTDTVFYYRVMPSIPVKEFCYKTISQKSVKDGLWTYYNQKGKAIRKEWYEEGVLVKVKK